MTMEYCMQLLNELAKTTKTEVGPIMLKIYMGELEKIGWQKAAKALEDSFRDLRRFPTCVEILEKAGHMEPDSDDQANLMAGTILECASTFGGYQEANARARMGDLAWEVVRRFGGWDVLCMLEIDELGAARAQLRDLARSVVAYASVGGLKDPFNLPEPKKGQITDVRSDGDNILKLLEKGK